MKHISLYIKLLALLGHVHQFPKMRVIFTHNYYMAYGSVTKREGHWILSLKGHSCSTNRLY